MTDIDFILAEARSTIESLQKLIAAAEHCDGCNDIVVFDDSQTMRRFRIIKSEVAGFFKLTVEQLVSPSRTEQISTARFAAFKFMREFTDATLEQIGRQFKGRGKDKGALVHKSIFHGLKKIKDIESTEPKFRADMKILRERIAERLNDPSSATASTARTERKGNDE